MALARKRDWKAEKINGQEEIYRGLALVRAERESDHVDIIRLAQAFAVCGLPYSRTSQRQIVRVIKLAKGTLEVTFTAVRDGVEIAYGSDREVLNWIIDRAITENSSFIHWETAMEHFKTTGKSSGGRDYKHLRERVMRLSYTAITVVRITDAGERGRVIPVISESNLPSSITGEYDDEDNGMPLGLRLDESFFNDVRLHHVPMLRSLLKATSASNQIQDCMVFLTYRSYSAQSDTCILWKDLMKQFWNADSNKSRLRSRFHEAITLLKTCWPELRAEAAASGLLIGPPTDNKHLIPQFNIPKQITEQQQENRLKKRIGQRVIENRRLF